MRIDSLTPDLSNNRLYYGQISTGYRYRYRYPGRCICRCSYDTDIAAQIGLYFHGKRVQPAHAFRKLLTNKLNVGPAL